MSEFKNRQSINPNRCKLILINDPPINPPNEILADIMRADTVVGNGEGTPINAETFNNMQSEIKAYADGNTFVYQESNWENAVAPYKIEIGVGMHNRGKCASIACFNNGSDEFEWHKDADGNIAIYSNVKVAVTVNLK